MSTTKRYTGVPIEVTKTALDGVESFMEATRKKVDDQTAPKPASTERHSTKVQ